jgi:hypothetical protein
MELLFEFLDLIPRPAAWRRMNGPMAFATAFLGLVFGLLFTVVGGYPVVAVSSWLARLAVMFLVFIGVSLIANTILGVTAFQRARSEPS